MRCGILGPLEVVGADAPVDLRGRKRRALAAYLLVHQGQPCPLGEIVEDLWNGSGASGATKTVQSYVSEFRRTLAPATISKQPTGYILELPDPDALDAGRFERLADAVSDEGEPAARIALTTDALSLWRGPPLAEFAGEEWAERAAARLTSTRLSLLEQHVDALLALGRHKEAIPALEPVVAEHPLDERLCAQLVVAYYRSSRQADAVSALVTIRQLLASELGLSLGPELLELESRVLQHDPELAAPTSAEGGRGATGVITFMFTDIVGSTEGWDTQPEAMSTAVARHEQLVSDAVHAAHGRVIRSLGEGDSMFSTFERASDGVAAAVEVISSIQREPWTVDPPLRLRVSVHSGEVEQRDGNYFGSTVNRAAWIRGLAEPNEVLCSRVTADLVADALPDGFRLEPRGTQALRGLRRPEEVFAVRPDRDAGRERGPDAAKFTVLGPVGVVDAPIESPHLRLLLARLLVDRNQTVPEDELTRAIWGSSLPRSARTSLQSKISRLRALVGTERIERDAGGYRISVDAEDVDAGRFERLVSDALANASAPDSLAMLDEALSLWSGPAYAETSGDAAIAAESNRLEALRRAAEDRRLELIVELGTREEALSESERLLARDPFRETARAIQLRALALAGRRVEALRTFHDYRTQLAEATGLTPSAPLVELERSLLDGEAPPPAPSRDSAEAEPPLHAGRDASASGIPWVGPLTAKRHLAGREPELRALTETIASAARGEPRFVVLTGEAGIGKTRLLDEVAMRAADRGFLVLRGSAVASRAGALGALRAAVKEITPTLAAEFLTLDDAEAADPATAERRSSARSLRFVDALADRAATTSVLLAIDDLQAVDDVSLGALELVQAAIADASAGSLRLLVVATHRSIGASEQVLARVGRMARAPHSLDIRLTGLDEPALVRLVADATTVAPTPALIDALSEASGNPLITIARLQSLATAHALVVRDGCLDLLATASTPVPYDLREIITSLLQAVEPSVRADFTRLALLGDGLPVETLRAATGWSEEHTADVLARGEEANLVRLHAEHVGFVHDLLRWSLVQSVPGMDRRQIHREFAGNLEPHTVEGDVQRVALLAEQLRLAGDRDPAARVGYWSELAGDQCLARALWSEAIRNYDAATDAADTDDARRGELQVKAGVACFHYHDVARARARLIPAIEELEARGLLAEVGTAALALHRAAFTLTQDTELVEQSSRALVHFIEVSDGVAELAASRALALGQLAEATFGTRNRAENEHLVDAARRCAAGTGDEVHALVEFAAGLTEFSDLELDTALASFRRSAQLAASARDPWYEAAGLGRIAFATILSGAVDTARQAIEHARELQHSLRLWAELSLTEALKGSVELLAGNAEGAIASAEEAIRYYERSGYRFTPALAFPTLAAAQLESGDVSGANATVERWRAASPVGRSIFEILVLVLGGDVEEAGRRLESRPLRVVPAESVDLLGLPALAAAARIALALPDRHVLTGLLPVVDHVIDRGVLATHAWPTYLPQLAADMAAALDEPDANRRATFARDSALELGVA